MHLIDGLMLAGFVCMVAGVYAAGYLHGYADHRAKLARLREKRQLRLAETRLDNLAQPEQIADAA